MDNARVLCIDDDLPILMALRHFPWPDYFCQWVGEARNGRDALDAVEQLKPDIALVDVAMPIMDGLDFIQQAKVQYPELRFIIISAFCDFDYARRALRYGVTEYLTKGEYSDAELGEILMTITGHQHGKYRYEVQKAIDAVKMRLQEDLSLEDLAGQLGISPNYLGTIFYQQTGKRFRDYLTCARMERARDLLLHTSLKIYEVAEQVGIHNPQYFTSLFQKFHNMLPGQLRR